MFEFATEIKIGIVIIVGLLVILVFIVMFRFITSRQRKYEVLRHLKHIGGFIWGAICTILGAAGIVLIGTTIYRGLYRVREPADPVILGMLAFVGVFAFLFFLLGLKVIRDTIRSMRHNWLAGLDLDKQPWMVNEAWRNKRIMHSNWVPILAFFAFMLGLPLVLALPALAVRTMPTDILAIAALITSGIVMALGCLYRYLKKQKVAITAQNFWMGLFLPLIIVAPGAFGLFASAINMVLEAVSSFLLFFLFVIVFGYLYRKKRKFGISTCHLKTLPAFIGNTFEAEVEVTFRKLKTGLPELPEGPVDVELRNVTAAGRNVVVNWMTKTMIPPDALARPGDGTLRIPVTLAIPNEAGEMIPKGWTDSAWQLKIRAPFPGVDYSSWFGVPVYFS